MSPGLEWLGTHLVDAALTAAASAVGGALASRSLRRRVRRLARVVAGLRARVHVLDAEHTTTRAIVVQLQARSADGSRLKGSA